MYAAEVLSPLRSLNGWLEETRRTPAGSTESREGRPGGPARKALNAGAARQRADSCRQVNLLHRPDLTGLG